MKTVSELCIRHRVTTILAVIMIVVFGVVFTTQLQLSLMPNIEQPMAMVTCTYPGASPADIEELITRPMEGAAMTVSGVKKVTSTSSTGVSSIMITYVDGTDLDMAATRLREQLDGANLPKDASKPVIISADLSSMMPTAIIAMEGDDLTRLQQFAEDVVQPALERIDGVASVTLYGGAKQEISVHLDSARALGYGLGNSYIAQCLSAENLLQPGGEVENGTKKFTVSTDAKFGSVSDVENTIIPLPAGGSVRLGEIARVAIETKEQETIARMNGKECVILYVKKQSGGNEHGISTKVEKQLEALKEEHAELNYYLAYSAAKYINIVTESAVQNIILGVALSALVVFLFLRRFGPTIAIAISMPVCILSVCVAMHLFHLTLNMMSLGGIAMGVGMIVDNSIVVLENIYRYSALGKDRMAACVEGTKEVTNSVVASTLTTAAVFVPLGLSGGIAGQLFKDFCLTIAFLILASLIIALTLVPLLCYLMLDEEKVRKAELRRKEKKPGAFARFAERMSKRYLGILAFFTKHVWAGMLASLALLAIFVLACVNTKMVALPTMDQGEVDVNASLPVGTSTKESVAIAEQIVDVVARDVPESKAYYYMVSASDSMVSDSGVSMGIDLVDRSDRKRSSTEIANDLRAPLANIAGGKLTASATGMFSLGDSGGNDINVLIRGKDLDVLTKIATDLTRQIEVLPDAVEVTSSVSELIPQVKVTMNRQAAAQYGLTAAQVGAAVRQELSGATATKVTVDGVELDVSIKGEGVASRSMDALRALAVTTPAGGSVALSAVADVELVQAPQSISRSNQTRQVTITGKTVSGDAAAMTEQIHKLIDAYPMPQGYTAATDGSYEDMLENYSDLLLALLVAVGLVYFVLAAQFESFAMPVIVMLILPVAFGGALFALPITGRSISMISLMSLIMLAGTVVNSSIILVDYINVRRREGEERSEAILHACPLRVRPVLMTTLTTVLAMLPMALAMGDTNEMMSDMGVTMISGMVVSTIITLLFTPVYYCLIDNIGKKKKKPALAAKAA